MLPRHFTQSALLKNKCQGNKKALTGKTKQGLFSPLKGQINPSPSALCTEEQLHRRTVYPRHKNPSGLKHAFARKRFVTMRKRKQILISIFHREADYTLRDFFVKQQLLGGRIIVAAVLSMASKRRHPEMQLFLSAPQERRLRWR